MQESSPNLPKAAHLSKGELSISYGLACTSHHHRCSMLVLLHRLTSSTSTSGRDLHTKPRAIALERTPSPDCWNLSNDNCQGKKLPFLSSLTLSGLSTGTGCCLLPGRWGELNHLGRALSPGISLYTQAFADYLWCLLDSFWLNKKSLSAGGAFPKQYIKLAAISRSYYCLPRTTLAQDCLA